MRGARVRRHAPWRPRATTRERRQLRPFCTAWTIGCAGGVAARGRAASPTKRGRYCIDVYVLFELRDFENGTSQLYLPLLSLLSSRTVGRLRCSTARRSICESTAALPAARSAPADLRRIRQSRWSKRRRAEGRRRRPVDHELEVNPVVRQLQEIRLVEPLMKFANEVWRVFRADAK